MKTNLTQIKVTIQGITPLIMHNDTLCNPLHPMAKKMKEISSIRKKTDEHHLAMARLEWEAGLYLSENLGIYLPTKCLFATIKGAAKKVKQGKTIVNAINFHSAVGFPVKEVVGKSPDDLWNVETASGIKKYAHCESVVVSRARIMRTRPIFDKWSVDFSLDLDKEVLSSSGFESFVQITGVQCGLCELRPERGNGSYGRFEITKFEEV